MSKFDHRPIIARLTAPSGAPEFRVIRREGAAVVALPCRYCVTYLIMAPETMAVVDAGSHADIPRILDLLEWTGRPADRVRHIIPSHLHFDHMLGMDALAAAIGAPLTLGRVAMEQLGGERAIDPPSRLHMLRSLPTWGMQGLPFPHRSDWEGFLKFYFKPGEPWRFSSPVGHVLGHGDEPPGLEGWTLLETPGHCDSSICLHHARAGLLISGDTIRNFLGGEWNSIVSDRPAYARTRRMLESLDVDIVLPAHGPVIGGKGIIGRLRSPSFFTP